MTPTVKATSVHDTVNAASFRVPSAEELAKRLSTTVNKSHKVIKPMTTNQFKAEMRKVGSNNPDIGIDDKDMIVLKKSYDRKIVETGVPLEAFSLE